MSRVNDAALILRGRVASTEARPCRLPMSRVSGTAPRSSTEAGCEAKHVTFVCRVCSVATVVPGSTRASREPKDICRGDDRATQTRSRRRRVSRRDTPRCVVAATSQRSPARIRACALSSMRSIDRGVVRCVAMAASMSVRGSRNAAQFRANRSTPTPQAVRELNACLLSSSRDREVAAAPTIALRALRVRADADASPIRCICFNCNK
jgi:hypothetical protein